MKDDEGMLKRQLPILSGMGLFYIIIIPMFGVPLIGVMVALMAKGVFDYGYLILAAGSVAIFLTVLLIFRVIRNMVKKFQKDGLAAGKDAASMRKGPVRVSVLNGLITFTLNDRNPARFLPSASSSPPLLPEPEAFEPAIGSGDIVARLKSLSELRQEGTIDEAEFLLLKSRIIEQTLEKPDANYDV